MFVAIWVVENQCRKSETCTPKSPIWRTFICWLRFWEQCPSSDFTIVLETSHSKSKSLFWYLLISSSLHFSSFPHLLCYLYPPPSCHPFMLHSVLCSIMPGPDRRGGCRYNVTSELMMEPSSGPSTPLPLGWYLLYSISSFILCLFIISLAGKDTTKYSKGTLNNNVLIAFTNT